MCQQFGPKRKNGTEYDWYTSSCIVNGKYLESNEYSFYPYTMIGEVQLKHLEIVYTSCTMLGTLFHSLSRLQTIIINNKNQNFFNF